jgi:hypothetical protein
VDLRAEALEFLATNPLEMPRAWYRAASAGLADPDLAARASRLLEIAELDSTCTVAA